MIRHRDREEEELGDEAGVRRQGGPEERPDAGATRPRRSTPFSRRSRRRCKRRRLGQLHRLRQVLDVRPQGAQGVNPRNPAEKVHIPAATVPKFTAGSTLKAAVAAAERRALGPAPEDRARAASSGPRSFLGRAPGSLRQTWTPSRAVATAAFADRLAEAVERKRSQLVVGLDPRPDLLPVELRGDAHLGRAGRGRGDRALLLRDHRRRRAVRRRGQAAARVLRGARRRRHARASRRSAPTRARPACS